MKDQDQIPADIAVVAQKFSQWRETRHQNRERIPDALWEAAVKLLKHHKSTVVCRNLRINPTSLKNRSESFVPALGVTRVEISAPLLPQTGVKLSRPDGVILEIAGALDSDKIFALVGAFCRGAER